ncbi:hypothetical protein [Rhodoplanes sp. Z2-YC6860]|uniref:hypothetical protein n=1 Tax=Rhodoplanes sp. Z2-YC6860 TaxID=674703 RepID=UPI0012EED89A|nr:hypothetical protein [Rhodoplanes sp. Z2-YC6860]
MADQKQKIVSLLKTAQMLANDLQEPRLAGLIDCALEEAIEYPPKHVPELGQN